MRGPLQDSTCGFTLEAGNLRPRPDWNDVRDLVHTAAQNLGRTLAELGELRGRADTLVLWFLSGRAIV